MAANGQEPQVGAEAEFTCLLVEYSMDQNICFFYSQDRQRRIAIFRREEGSFGFAEQYYFYNEVVDIKGWASYPPESSFYADLEIAKNEAVLNIRWTPSEDGFVAAGTEV